MWWTTRGAIKVGYGASFIFHGEWDAESNCFGELPENADFQYKSYQMKEAERGALTSQMTYWKWQTPEASVSRKRF